MQPIGLDAGALLFYAVCWFGYMAYSERGGRATRNLIGTMAAQRAAWMREMLARDNRILDVQVVRSAVQTAQFFASTSIIIVAGLLTVLGATDTAIAILSELPYAVETARTVWEIKVVVLLLIFVYAFFKFAWSTRQYGYCAILIGGAPACDALPADADAIADNIAWVATLAAKHSNHGIRAYYFGFALLSWFIHPLLVIPTAAWVVAVLYRREFRSNTLARLRALAPTVD